MHKHLRNHASKEKLEKLVGELETGPIMSVFENFEGITLEGNVSGKVHVVESNHRNLDIALVLFNVLGLLELEVVLDGLSGELDLGIATRRVARFEGPVSDEDGNRGDQGDEDERLDASAELAGKVKGDNQDGAKENPVAECLASGSLCGEGSICDCRILARPIRSAEERI